MNLSSGQKLIVVYVAIAVVAIAVIALLIVPKFTEVASLSKQIDDAESEIASAQSLLSQRQAQKARSSETDAQLLALSNELPENPEMPSLIIELQDTVNISGLEFVSIHPALPEVREAGYSAVGSEMIVRGRWQDLVDLLQRLRRVTRQVRIREFEITVPDLDEGDESADEDEPVQVEALLFIEVYTMPSDVQPVAETVPAPTTEP